MSATTPPQDPQDSYPDQCSGNAALCVCQKHHTARQSSAIRSMLDEPRTCGFCGDKDPRWHGGLSSAWTVKDGLDRCPDCAWMQSGPDADVQREAARTDPRGLGDGLGS